MAAVVVLASLLGTARAATSPPPLYTYATMSDGVRIALAVAFPRGFGAQPQWPALFMMDGYEGAASPLDPSEYLDHYVMIHASIRGTGCSGGRFDLFDRRSAEDGYEIIENWIVKQRWSNARVGIIGHSYPGLTGFLVASTNPPHLTAIAVSGLIDDLYRGISYMGGVPDPGFPLLWPTIIRPATELVGNIPRYRQHDPVCAENIATRPAPNALDDPVVNGAADREDGVWWASHSLITYIAGIQRPTWIAQQYQDEQTGPRGGVELWQHIPAGVPKRLVLTNGVHATNDVQRGDRVAWLDCWIRSDCRGDIADPARRVQIRFETQGPGNDPQFDTLNAPYVSSAFPLPETDWQRYFLHGDGTLSTAVPRAGEPRRSFVALPFGREAYVSGAGVADTFGTEAERVLDGQYRKSYGRVDAASGPDVLTYSVPFAHTATIAGPIDVTLWASSTAIDTDFFVQLIDVDPSGNESFLQRGLLRASFRALDTLRSDDVPAGPHHGEIYRPYHPFTDPSYLMPTKPYRFDIEVFPVGNVFRAGHRLVVAVYSPPAMDELYAYGSGQPPALNTILDDPAHPSSILLPFLPVLPPISAAPPPCGTQTGVRCVKPVR